MIVSCGSRQNAAVAPARPGGRAKTRRGATSGAWALPIQARPTARVADAAAASAPSAAERAGQYCAGTDPAALRHATIPPPGLRPSQRTGPAGHADSPRRDHPKWPHESASARAPHPAPAVPCRAPAGQSAAPARPATHSTAAIAARRRWRTPSAAGKNAAWRRTTPHPDSQAPPPARSGAHPRRAGQAQEERRLCSFFVLTKPQAKTQGQIFQKCRKLRWGDQ